MSNENNVGSIKVSLWNPSAAANWSLLFSPVFGAWIHAKKWISLGKTDKAQKSMYWVYGGLAVLPLAIFLPDIISRTVGIGYLASWYFLFAKQQVKYIKENLDGNYEKKSWGKPLGIAIVALIGFVMFLGSVVINVDS